MRVPPAKVPRHLAPARHPPPLPAQSPLPPGLQAELLADVERIRAHHPHQRIVECSDQLEAWGLKGACGLDRVELVHKVIFKLQQRYNTIPMQTYEYSSRRAHVQHFRRALHLPGIRTVCEIGFNAGHGASIWLEGSDVTMLHSFDLPLSNYSTAARNLSRALYPNRISFHDGNSKLTLPPFVDSVRKGQTPPCDLWYIDGLHTHSHNMHYGPYDDMRQALQTSHNGTILIADDCTRKWAAVTNGWQRLTAGTRSAVTRISLWDVLPERSSYNKTGWCAGRVLMQ